MTRDSQTEALLERCAQLNVFSAGDLDDFLARNRTQMSEGELDYLANALNLRVSRKTLNHWRGNLDHQVALKRKLNAAYRHLRRAAVAAALNEAIAEADAMLGDSAE